MTGLRAWLKIWAGLLMGAASAAVFAEAWHLGRLADKLDTSPTGGLRACYLGICGQSARDVELELAVMRHPPPGDGVSALAALIFLAGLMILLGAVTQVFYGVDERWQTVTAASRSAHEQWRMPAARDLWLLAALMPVPQRERWLAEILSALHEAGPGRRKQVIRDYRANAPRVLFLAWDAPLRRAASRWLRAQRR